MPYEKAPSSGAFLPASLMYFLSGEPMHYLSGVDSWHPKYKAVYLPQKDDTGFVCGFIAFKDGELKMPPKWLGQNKGLKLKRA